MRTLLVTLTIIGCVMTESSFAQSEFSVSLQTRTGDRQTVSSNKQTWKPSETVIIVCDVWDYHHCLNAVRRIEEFVPTLDRVLKNARERGIVIIHSPSDCMESYRNHPGRKRAMTATAARYSPPDIGAWCSVVPNEEKAVYPIDQSDGGEDDDPKEHAEWAAKLESLGRNPNMPWKKQTDMITIDQDRDYISDQGDEVWNILQSRGIKNVILTGVHTNMCVLGRPFGLRQMVRNGKNVVLMRDMTDTMYNPKSWPFVSHFEGTRRVIAHIEQHVCPTITSDQFVGGKPFRFKGDDGQPTGRVADTDLAKHWTPVLVPHETEDMKATGWYRAVVKIPATWANAKPTLLLKRKLGQNHQVSCNGKPCQPLANGQFALPVDSIEADDWNLIVVRISGKGRLHAAPTLITGTEKLVMSGRWQHRIGDNDLHQSMPLPAKFGGSADVAFLPPDPMWVPRPVSRIGQFTSGIEGPACDHMGNVYAVNFAQQATIGRVDPSGGAEVFVRLPKGSTGNGIRFGGKNFFYVADYTGHNVLKVDLATRDVSVFAHNDQMNQPNDLAIAPNGTLYASDPNWKEGTGQLWRIDIDGTTTRLEQAMGTTNGIEVSPDGKTLYVNESKQRNIWAYDITGDGSVQNKRILKKFDDHGFDGMRCDVDGNLYVARHGKGTVVKLSPKGDVLREIEVLGARPSNLCFGGPDGRTIYVTEVDFERLVSFRVDRPGRSWNLNR